MTSSGDTGIWLTLVELSLTKPAGLFSTFLRPDRYELALEQTVYLLILGGSFSSLLPFQPFIDCVNVVLSERLNDFLTEFLDLSGDTTLFLVEQLKLLLRALGFSSVGGRTELSSLSVPTVRRSV